MKRKIIAAAVFSAMVLSACGEAEENSGTETSVTSEVTEASSVTASETSETTAATESVTTEETAETEPDGSIVPEAVAAVLDNEDYWTDFLDGSVGESFGDYKFWFQDMDMDGTPEFIAGGGVYGAHAAFGYYIFRCTEGRVELIGSTDSYDEPGEMLMFWDRGEDENYSPDSSVDFFCRLYKDKYSDSYTYITSNIDSTAAETYYMLDKLTPKDGALNSERLMQLTKVWDIEGDEPSVSSYRYNEQWNDEISDYENTTDRLGFLSQYDELFSGLIPCDVTIGVFDYASKGYDDNGEEYIKRTYAALSRDEKLEQLTESFNAWGYSENDSAVPPFASAIDELRDYNG